LTKPELDSHNDYNESVWTTLGHKAFDNEYIVGLNSSVEFWDEDD
jgi:hypothetical protein